MAGYLAESAVRKDFDPGLAALDQQMNAVIATLLNCPNIMILALGNVHGSLDTPLPTIVSMQHLERLQISDVHYRMHVVKHLRCPNIKELDLGTRFKYLDVGHVLLMLGGEAWDGLIEYSGRPTDLEELEAVLRRAQFVYNVEDDSE